VGHTKPICPPCEQIHKFEYVVHLNLIFAVCFDPKNYSEKTSCLLVIDTLTGKTVQKVEYPANELPNSLACAVVGEGAYGVLNVFVGTSEMP
jgi:hypothetical protein